MSEFSAHSFDPPRSRIAPTAFDARTLSGAARSIRFEAWTLVVVVKGHCDGCRDFMEDAGDDLDDVRVVVVAASAPENDEWASSRYEVLLAPTFLATLDAPSPPSYVLIDPSRASVVTEGVLFSVAQVAREIASFQSA